MAQIHVHNPYTGDDAATCSVSFAAQQKLKDTDLTGKQTEAQFNASKLLGEWGVIKGKVTNGEIPAGTKVLSGVDENATRITISATSNPNTFFWKTYPADIHKQGVSVQYDKDLLDHLLQNAQVKWSVPGSAKTAATPSPAVPAGSSSVGSMSHEDVATLFVTIKDKLATEKGLNIKGANPALDAEVYKAIGEQTGYTAAEAKAKVDAYKAGGKKLSALKKKTLKSPKNVPDPKPNDVPTKATTATAEAAATKVAQAAEAKPTKLYSNQDVAAQYVIAKDAIVAASNGKWTLYTKSDELDAAIFKAVQDVTGHSPTQAKQAIADYLATGKKLSQLKKSLIKEGKLKPEADTLKKPDATKKVNTPDPEQTATEAKEEINTKAEAGHSPPEAPLSGDTSKFTQPQKQLLYTYFKQQPSGKYLTDSPQSTYEALLKTQGKVQDKELQDATLLQIVRLIDEQGAKKFNVPNEKVFEKKVITWLTTPDGKATSAALKHKLAEEIAAEKKKAERAAYLAKKAKELEDNQPPLPPDSNLFSEISVTKAYALQEEMTRGNPWTTRQSADLRHYTGSNYHAMNGHLRKGSHVSDRDKQAIEGAKAGMRPVTENIVVHRGTGLDQFGLHDENEVWGLTGKLLEDKGFMSTSVGGAAAFGGKILLEIQAPRGTKMAFVKKISHFSNENEMLLDAGIRYRVLRVETSGEGWSKKYKVIVRVEQ